ncbi:unnamed protein product [Mortierella alpina]
MSTPISIVVRASSEHKYSISTNHADSVLDLKNKIALQDTTPPERVRLVYSGRVLKDTNTLGSYKIADGHTIHLVRSPNILPPLSSPPASTTSSPTTPISTSSQTAATTSATPRTTSSSPDVGPFPSPRTYTSRNSSDSSGLGEDAPGRFNNTGNGNTMDPAIMTQMMQDPNFAQYMSSMLQNPRIIESMLALNPFLQSMGPQAGEMLRSSQFQAMISDPETLRQVARMGSQIGCHGGMESANTTGCSSPTAGTESIVGLPSSSAARAVTPSAAIHQFALNGESTLSSRVGTSSSAASHHMANYWSQQVGALRASLGLSSPSTLKQEPLGFEERYQVELKKLNEMGFWDAAKNVRALVASSGNLNGAIELLFSGAI